MISQYEKPALRMCSLDLVSSVVYLAFLDPAKARSMKLTVEYMFA